MSKTPLSPLYSSLDRIPTASSGSSGQKSQTIACLQPQKCFQFRKPTNSFKYKNNNSCHTFPTTNRYSSGDKPLKKSHHSYPISIQTFKEPTDMPTPTPKLFFTDSVSAYYGISEDPYCKRDSIYALFVINLFAFLLEYQSI